MYIQMYTIMLVDMMDMMIAVMVMMGKRMIVVGDASGDVMMMLVMKVKMPIGPAQPYPVSFPSHIRKVESVEFLLVLDLACLQGL